MDVRDEELARAKEEARLLLAQQRKHTKEMAELEARTAIPSKPDADLPTCNIDPELVAELRPPCRHLLAQSSQAPSAHAQERYAFVRRRRVLCSFASARRTRSWRRHAASLRRRSTSSRRSARPAARAYLPAKAYAGRLHRPLRAPVQQPA